jgi:hypothetical protein
MKMVEAQWMIAAEAGHDLWRRAHEVLTPTGPCARVNDVVGQIAERMRESEPSCRALQGVAKPALSGGGWGSNALSAFGRLRERNGSPV